jgi:hypothetical protein
MVVLFRTAVLKYGLIIFFCISNGTCTFKVPNQNGIYIRKINCMDQRAAAPPDMPIDLDLGVLDSQGSPYTIRINSQNMYCIVALPFQSP